MKAAKLVAWALVVGAAVPASAKGKKAAADDDSGDDVTSTDDATDTTSNDDAKPTKPKQKARQGGDTEPEVQKQDLNGHDLGTTKKENAFESDRFFVDKTDTAKTEKGTLVQGSLTSTTFAYHESGGNLPASTTVLGQSMVPSASPFSRVFTDLRLQTDFRHIGGGRWDARIDVRGRVVNNPDPLTAGYTPATDSKIQSGFLGDNELEIREAWLVRNGIQSDVFLGRQFIPDLGGVKIDGVRIDYASSAKFTLLGFGGLYPIRGSRSITDDYTPLLSNPDATGNRSSAGRFVGAGGFGAAYRTLESYGSFGGVVLAPLSSESPRVFGTSTGYWRYGSKLDFYHFAILDLVGSNAVNAGLTNLSLGVNYKPDQRLRATASLNRVDTDTLNVQAQAFLSNPDVTNAFTAVQNEAYLQRIATNEARGSLSAGLGELQRFEATAALTYRYRGDVTLSSAPMTGTPVTTYLLKSAQSVEVYGSITDRHSYKDLRLGADLSRTIGVGGVTYDHTTALQLRAFASHELSNGHGEWEAEVSYLSTKDDQAGVACSLADLGTCYGAANTSILSIGGTLYYRINRDWFLIGSAFLNRTSVTHLDTAGSVEDPAELGISGLFRIAYRF
jgi:hypothetical protein